MDSGLDGPSFHTQVGKTKLVLTYLVCLLVCFTLLIFWHEVMGHGLVGVLAGGQVTHVEVWGLKLWPELRWIGWSGSPGRCGVEGITTVTGWALHIVAGPLSTWCVSVLAVILLWARRWTSLPRVILVCLSLWWVDLFHKAMTSFGIRRFIFWGPAGNIHYDAAVSLGIPGPLFQAFAVGTSVCLLAGLVVRLIGDHRRPTSLCKLNKLRPV